MKPIIEAVSGYLTKKDNLPKNFTTETEFIRYALDSAAIVAMTDVKGTITFVNSKFCEISGYTREELIGANHRILKSGIHSTDFFRTVYKHIASGRVWYGELCNRRKDGSLYWVDTTIVPHINASGRVDSYTAIRFDITVRQEMEELLREAVSLDHLTGIANRRKFLALLDDALQWAEENNGRVFLALLDIDTFKIVNDTFGHDAGDALLRLVSQRLMRYSETNCKIARLSGDEFGLILTGLNVDAAEVLIESVLGDLRTPFKLAGNKWNCSVSIGGAIWPDHAETQDHLFKAADLALYRAKELGRDRYKLFTPSLRETAERKVELLQAVKHGLNNEQFLLHYQPIVSARGEEVIALEALLRWKHPKRGLITPGAFLSDIHDPGVHAAIGMFVVEHAVCDLAAMLELGLPVGKVAVNVTNADFRSDAFVNYFVALTEQNRLDPKQFCIEVTEGVFLGPDFQHIEKHLKQLHNTGVEIALDDFGTGFASLTHLHRMPIDRIKIDRSFVSQLPHNKEDCAIVRGVVDLARALGKAVTAEGVETAAQAELLRDIGCDHLQGWHFSKAVSLERLAYVLRNLPNTDDSCMRPRLAV